MSQPRRADVEPSELEDFDFVLARLRRIFGNSDEPDPERFGMGPHDTTDYWRALLNAPPLCAALTRVGTLVRLAGERPGSYTHADRELADQALSQFLGANYLLPLHIPDAIAVGVRPEAIAALRAGSDNRLTADELETVIYVRQVLGGTVTDESWEAMSRRLGTRGLIDFTVFVCHMMLTVRLMQALGVPEPPDELVDGMIADLASGARPLPDDFRTRLG